MSTEPRPSRPISSGDGGATLATTSPPKPSPIEAPASSYAASGWCGLGACAGLDHDVDPALGESLNGLGHERHAALALGLLLRYRDLHLGGRCGGQRARKGSRAVRGVRRGAGAHLDCPAVRRVLIPVLVLPRGGPPPPPPPRPRVPACALGTSAADLRGFQAAALARAERRYQGAKAGGAPSPPAVAAYVYGLAPLSVRNTVPRFPRNQIISIAELVEPDGAHGDRPERGHHLHRRADRPRRRAARGGRARHARALLRAPVHGRLLEHLRLHRPAHDRHEAGLVRARAARLLGPLPGGRQAACGAPRT